MTELEPYLAVIDCGGVGYACNTTGVTVSALRKGEEATLYTYLHVREELFDLYGFATKNELYWLQAPARVSGVGPRAALSVLSVCSPERLAMAIITGDEKALTSAQGIGKKIASRIILELKDKLAKEQAPGAPVSAPGAVGVPQMQVLRGGRRARGPGYSSSECRSATAHRHRGAALEDTIRQALKRW